VHCDCKACANHNDVDSAPYSPRRWPLAGSGKVVTLQFLRLRRQDLHISSTPRLFRNGSPSCKDRPSVGHRFQESYSKAFLNDWKAENVRAIILASKCLATHASPQRDRLLTICGHTTADQYVRPHAPSKSMRRKYSRSMNLKDHRAAINPIISK
jgi:hypothetical protein